MSKPRPKKCGGCGVKFQPQRLLQAACSPACAIVLTVKNRKKKERREIQDAKLKLKSRSQWLREAQAAVNAFIRCRDKGQPCISCGRQHTGQIHAGHYRSVGACPELRFDELNIHAQCSPCNNHLSGNIVEYRKGLIAKIGVEKVEWLEGKHEPKRYTVEDAKEIKKVYKLKLKGLQTDD